MKIYIAGAITHDSHYFKKFKRAEQFLKYNGHEVYNPAKEALKLPKPTTRKGYIDVGLKELMNCDAIYLLASSIYSDGAQLELKYALTTGMKVYKENKELYELIDWSKMSNVTITLS